MSEYCSFSLGDINIIEINKKSRIVIFSQNLIHEDIDFHSVINAIKSKIEISIKDKILFSSSNNENYLLSITSALILDTAEPLNTSKKSKALKIIKRKLSKEVE